MASDVKGGFILDCFDAAEFQDSHDALDSVFSQRFGFSVIPIQAVLEFVDQSNALFDNREPTSARIGVGGDCVGFTGRYSAFIDGRHLALSSVFLPNAAWSRRVMGREERLGLP
jgi:hypothetical protein